MWKCLFVGQFELRRHSSMALSDLLGSYFAFYGLIGLLRPFIVLYGIFMAFYGFILPFLAVIDPNSFGLVCGAKRNQKRRGKVSGSNDQSETLARLPMISIPTFTSLSNDANLLVL